MDCSHTSGLAVKMRRFLIVCALVALTTAYKTYSGYQVFKVIPNNEDQLMMLRRMQDDIKLDFWIEPRGVGMDSVIMVPPERLLKFKAKLQLYTLTGELTIPDVGVLIAEEQERLAGKKAFDINDWNTYEDITSQLRVWQSVCPTKGLSCDITNLGDSYEGRPIEAFSISTGGSGKKQIWIDSLIHPREYIAGSTSLYFIDHIVNTYDSDSDVTHLLDSYDWVFVPVMNPDGYVYTWTDDVMWRKNREPNPASVCIGTDLNRNYDTGCWGCDGTSTSPCADTYGGGSAGSAPETKIIQNELQQRSSNLLAMISMHSYIKMWLHPWGHRTPPPGAACQVAEHQENLQQVGDATISAIMNSEDGQTGWKAGSVCTTIYPASGGSLDYSYKQGIKYSYTPELRGDYFKPPPSEIGPAFRETWAGIVALVAEIETIEG